MTRDAFRRAARLAAALCLILGTACADDSAPVAAHAPRPARAVSVRMLALGDSYTSGEAIPETKSWPHQLEAELLGDSVRVDSLTIVARTGWTTTDLLVAMNKSHLVQAYDLVTLQIGVNNQYGGLPFEVFQDEFQELVARAIVLAGNQPGHVVVLTIPDYSVTPVGIRIDPDRTRGEIDAYNGFIAATLDSTETALVNITDTSRQAGDDPSLIARDGLHPSAKMYAAWVELLRPVVARIFDRGGAGR